VAALGLGQRAGEPRAVGEELHLARVAEPRRPRAHRPHVRAADRALGVLVDDDVAGAGGRRLEEDDLLVRLVDEPTLCHASPEIGFGGIEPRTTDGATATAADAAAAGVVGVCLYRNAVDDHGVVQARLRQRPRDVELRRDAIARERPGVARRRGGADDAVGDALDDRALHLRRAGVLGDLHDAIAAVDVLPLHAGPVVVGAVRLLVLRAVVGPA